MLKNPIKWESGSFDLLFTLKIFSKPKTQFSEPQISEILDLMNELQLPSHILLFVQARFSE